MAVVAARRFTEKTGRYVYTRPGDSSSRCNTVCKYWLAGKCTRNPCNFLHQELKSPFVQQKYSRNRYALTEDCQQKKSTENGSTNGLSLATNVSRTGVKRTENRFENVPPSSIQNRIIKKPRTLIEGQPRQNLKIERPKTSLSETVGIRNGGKANALERIAANQGISAKKTPNNSTEVEQQRKTPYHDNTKQLPAALISCQDTRTVNTPEKICELWVSGNCVMGDRCNNLHSWSCGDGLSMMTKLEGHNKSITGIALPTGSNRLFTGCKDGTVIIWDCSTGKSVHTANLNDEIGSIVSDGPWVFIGLPNVVKASNIQTLAEYSLNEPVGQVYAMAVSDDFLFAGGQDGVITAWKISSESNPPLQYAASLKGHTSAVTSLTVGVAGFYSGSVDGTIMAWDLKSLQCDHILKGHSNVVTSLLCFDEYLLSCSLDQKINVWHLTQDGNFEVTYAHNVQHGVLTLCGANDEESNPILICSCDDNIVRLFDLPTFKERAKIFSKGEVRSLEYCTSSMFCTGDVSGDLTVWKLAKKSSLTL